MVRPLRIDLPGGIWHVTARGNNRAAIFGSPEHRDRLLATVGRVIKRYRWICHAYVVMPNHYHLLLETPVPNLSLGMRQLNGLYAQWFNRRHARSGHVFGGRFASVAVQHDEHLLESGRYIVLNPIRTVDPSRYQDWRWSSYRATAGLAAPPEWFRAENVLRMLATSRHAAQRRYREYVGEGVEEALRERLVGEIYLGDESFIRTLMPDGPVEEVPRAHWQPLRPTLDELGRDGEAILAAYRRYGYRLREIAAHLGVHPSTVSRVLDAIERGVDAS